MEFESLRISSITLAEMKQVSGGCQVLLDRDDVTRFEKQGRRSNPVSRAVVEPAQRIVKVDRDADMEKRSAVRNKTPTPFPGPSCSTAATVGSPNLTDVEPRIKIEDARRHDGSRTKKTAVKHFRTRNRMHRGRHSCLFCKIEFPSWSKLEVHMRVHIYERPFVCGLCQAPFGSAGNLQSHQLTVHSKGEKKFACGHCGMQFHFKATLKRHERVHSSERPFPCDLCETSFRHKESLETHLRYHTGERPYKCEVCQKRFITTRDLTQHKFTHRPVTLRPYKCTRCPKTFCQKTNLNRHVNQHTGNKPYTCGTCKKTFFSSQALQLHCKAKGHRFAGSKSRRGSSLAAVVKQERTE